MTYQSRPGSELWYEFHTFQEHYEATKGALSSDDMLALWSALWRLTKQVNADRRQAKMNERKQQRAH